MRDRADDKRKPSQARSPSSFLCLSCSFCLSSSCPSSFCAFCACPSSFCVSCAFDPAHCHCCCRCYRRCSSRRMTTMMTMGTCHASACPSLVWTHRMSRMLVSASSRMQRGHCVCMALAHDLPLLQQWRESICRYCIGVPARSTFFIFPYRPWDYPALLVHARLPLALGALHGACQEGGRGELQTIFWREQNPLPFFFSIQCIGIKPTFSQ